MARGLRIKSSGEGTAYYHLISRCSNKQFLFRKAAAKDRLMDLAKRAAEFSGFKTGVALRKAFSLRTGMSMRDWRKRELF